MQMVKGAFFNHFEIFCQGPGAWPDNFWMMFGHPLKNLKKHVWTILIKIHNLYSVATPQYHNFGTEKGRTTWRRNSRQ